MRLIGRDPEQVLQIELVAAHGSKRRKGLLGEDDIDQGKALVIRTRQVHTIGMRFAIDVIYLSRSGEVLAVRTLPPMRLGPLVMRAARVLEMRAGEARRLGIDVGMKLLDDQ